MKKQILIFTALLFSANTLLAQTNWDYNPKAKTADSSEVDKDDSTSFFSKQFALPNVNFNTPIKPENKKAVKDSSNRDKVRVDTPWVAPSSPNILKRKKRKR